MSPKAKAQYMDDLQKSPGWKILTDELNEVKNGLESIILKGQYSTQIEGDVLRIKLMNITFLLDLPNKLVDSAPREHTTDDIDSYMDVEELTLLKKYGTAQS